MTLPTARENAIRAWGKPDGFRSEIKDLSMYHAKLATEQRDKDIAKELRAILANEDSFLVKLVMVRKLSEQLEDGEKEARR